MMMKSFPFFKVPSDYNDYCSSPVITRIKDWCFYIIIKISVQQRKNLITHASYLLSLLFKVENKFWSVIFMHKNF